MNIPEERLSEHFFLSELCETRHVDIDNTPGPLEIENLRKLALVLEQIRAGLGDPVIVVSSGFRCAALNSAVGSKPTSAHLLGLAADFTARSFGNPLKVAEAIVDMKLPGIDQVIHEFGRWVHVGLAKPGNDPRKQALTIDKEGTRMGLHEAR